jgi:hypothetical protein
MGILRVYLHTFLGIFTVLRLTCAGPFAWTGAKLEFWDPQKDEYSRKAEKV